MQLAVVDFVFASIVLIMVVRCALRGFVEEFLSVASLVVGVLFAVLFFRPGAAFAVKTLGIKILPEVAAFAALFLIAFIAVKILEKILADVVRQVDVLGLDKGLGIVLGLVEGLLFVSVVLFLLSVQPLFDTAALLKNSVFAKYLMPLVSLASETAAAAAKKGS